MPDLRIENTSIHFVGVVALDQVSFDIRQGEIFSLIGPNGSGKSTLFNCINGFNHPQEGVIYYGETNILNIPPHKVASLGIARTFQNLQSIPYMTVLDNILLGAHRRIDFSETVQRLVSRRQRTREEALALEIMSFLGIDNYEKKYLGGQPYGIQKLVEIARALVVDPSLILLDEPAAGMNEQETFEIAKIITEIRDDLGVTVLVVEHDMNLVMSISDRICVLDSGKVIALGRGPEIKNHPDVIRTYLGDSNDA